MNIWFPSSPFRGLAPYAKAVANPVPQPGIDISQFGALEGDSTTYSEDFILFPNLEVLQIIRLLKTTLLASRERIPSFLNRIRRWLPELSTLACSGRFSLLDGDQKQIRTLHIRTLWKIYSLHTHGCIHASRRMRATKQNSLSALCLLLFENGNIVWIFTVDTISSWKVQFLSKLRNLPTGPRKSIRKEGCSNSEDNHSSDTKTTAKGLTRIPRASKKSIPNFPRFRVTPIEKKSEFHQETYIFKRGLY